MSSSDAGYGICGHKNSFSTGVKQGNYVEDRFGKELARTGQAYPMARLTEASANYVDPREMPNKSANAPEEDLNERAMIRAGLPYNLVFEHGTPHIPTKPELDAKYTPSSSDIGGSLPLKPPTTQAQSALAKDREMKRAREQREQRHAYVTTAQTIVPAIVRGQDQ